MRIIVALLVAVTVADTARACPFCVAEMQTLSELMDTSDVVAIGGLAKRMPLPEQNGPGSKPIDGVPYGTIDPDSGEALFDVETVLKGEDQLLVGDEVEAIYFGSAALETAFLLRGVGDPVEWALPIELSPLAVDYIKRLPELPKAGPDRLAFFQPYLEHEDRQLAQDAYDEFARAPYEDLRGLGEQIDLDRVLQMIGDPRVSPSRRRLFFTMLGVRGGQEHLPMLEDLLATDEAVLTPAAEAAAEAALAAGGSLSVVLAPEVVAGSERRRKLGLDAMIACYLTLRGQDGLDLVDRRFFGNTKANQTHIYSAMMALRFLADQSEAKEDAVGALPQVSRDRLLQSARLLLDNPQFADQVITDLARWEDWSVMPRLAEMFRVADKPGSGVSKYVREPIVTFLDVASEQEGEVGKQATDLIAQLEPLDTETFRRARAYQAFGFLRSARKGDDPLREDAEGADPGEELSDAEFDEAVAAQEDAPPNPADFGAWPPEPVAETAAGDEDSPASTEDSPPADAIAQEPPTEGAAPAAAAARQPEIPAGPEPLTPPSRMVLFLALVAAAAGCFGLFWLILRGGA